LRRVNPSAYLFYVKFGESVVCGSSPETHLKVKDRVATLRPIAGTYALPAPATRPTESDIEKLKASLLADEKELAEHLMLVDLARNDLYTSCKTESVSVDKSFAAEVYSHLIHIVSEVSGTLREDLNSFDLFKRTFPAGTVSGAPKVRAIELIDSYEVSDRGFYSGCVGYIGFNGNLDTCITIRSAQFLRGEMVMRAGAGIVFDSVPEKEFAEIENKLKALFVALENISGVENLDVFTDR
jgi:anthranilate synthase component 1